MTVGHIARKTLFPLAEEFLLQTWEHLLCQASFGIGWRLHLSLLRELKMRTKASGAVVKDRFVGPYADRYEYDFKRCNKADGWRQYDTEQDASYFGVWVHPERRVIVTFAEGDETTVECPTQEAFEAEIREMNEFYGSPPPSWTIRNVKTGLWWSNLIGWVDKLSADRFSNHEHNTLRLPMEGEWVQS